MAPQKPVDKRIQTILDFAAQTQHVLQDRSLVPARKDLDAYIKLLPTLNPGTHAKELDRLGAELWNVANGILSENAQSDLIRVGVRVRIFALLLLDNTLRASQRRSKDHDEQIRILKIATRASKLCLENDELDLALIALEICSHHSPQSTEIQPVLQISSINQDILNGREQILHNLAGELLLLRLHHAWKSKRLDLAEHFFSKVDLPRSNTNLVLKAADLFHEISQSFLQPDPQRQAVVWSERAFAALVKLDSEALTQEAAELLLTVGIALIDDMLSFETENYRRRANEICHQLENKAYLGNRVVIPAARIRLIITEERVDPAQLSAALSHIVRVPVLTEDNFKMIMRNLHKAAKVSRQTTLPVLKAFINDRLSLEVEQSDSESEHLREWLEKATVTYIHLATSRPIAVVAEMLDNLQELFDRLQARQDASFSTKATHAAQTLLWKASGDADKTASYRWCALLRHSIFENAGHLNKARIGRKLMRLALEDGNISMAREAFFQMPSAAQNDPPSRYLSFKLALLSKDEEFAMDSLICVMKATPKDPTFIYACVLESQQSDMRHMAVVALQSILDQRPQGIHLPSLLRCTARLLIAELRDVQAYEGDMTKVVDVFETAARCMDDLRKSNQWRAEIQWFSKNIYNLVIRMSGKMNPEHLLRLLDACMQFLEAYPNDIALLQQDDVLRRQILCHFLAATALIIMGRTGDQADEEYIVQCYLHAQQRVQAFGKLCDKIKDAESNREAFDSRAFAMLKFNLECVLQLKQWEKLSDALNACLDIPGIGRWDALADLMIISHRELDRAHQDVHTEMMTNLLQRMINDSWKREKDICKVARWLRFTFVLCLEHTEGEFSLKLLQQAASMAENGFRDKHDPYPEAELQWLSATSFNHAVDLLGEGNTAYLIWIDAALDVARWSQDGGALHGIFTAKRALAIEREKELAK